jgi:hypothetical protein
MKFEKIDPDDGGNDLIQYRCNLCCRIERLRLFRRVREQPALARQAPGDATRKA